MIPIFRAEIKDGLAEAFENNSIILSSQLKNSEVDIRDQVKDLIRTEAGETVDLYPLNTILVSTGWNKNADIFEKLPTWLAKDTPINKPINIGHDHTKIRGHITASTVINEAGNVIDSKSAIDEVPDFFHILTSAFLYKVWKPQEIQDEVNAIIKEIARGEWYVSMECIFRGFDYGVIDTDGNHSTIARNENTAFLTKYLKAYGGTGEYEGRRIGRTLREITFSGKGLVKNPANPYSIIITDKFKSQASLNEIGDKMSDKVDNTEVVDLAKKLAVSEASVATLTEKNAKTEAERVKLEKDLASAKEEIQTAAKKADEADKKAKDAEKAKDDAEAKLKVASDELNKMKAEVTKASRLALIKEKIAKPEDAEAFYKKFEHLDDKTFAEVIGVVKAAEKNDAEKATEDEYKKAGGKKAEASELDNKVDTTVQVPEGKAEASDKTVESLKEYFKAQLTKK